MAIYIAASFLTFFHGNPEKNPVKLHYGTLVSSLQKYHTSASTKDAHLLDKSNCVLREPLFFLQ